MNSKELKSIIDATYVWIDHRDKNTFCCVSDLSYPAQKFSHHNEDFLSELLDLFGKKEAELLEAIDTEPVLESNLTSILSSSRISEKYEAYDSCRHGPLYYTKETVKQYQKEDKMDARNDVAY